MRIRHYWKAIIVALCCGTIKSCPHGFFEASEGTCLHIAQPGMNSREDYCRSYGSKVFGRPVSDDIREKLAEEMVKEAEKFMPRLSYLGMRKKPPSGSSFTPNENIWRFEGEDEEFDASDYKLWYSQSQNYDCAITGIDFDFKAMNYDCKDFSGVCEKKEPCYDKDLVYADYAGLCLLVMVENKNYAASNKACKDKDGHLVHMKTEENRKSVKLAFYNQRFAGGLYVGLRKKGNGKGKGAWEYDNGEKLKEEFAEDDKMEYSCGGVRILEDLKTLGLYTIPCDDHRLHFMCEIREKDDK